MAVGKNKRSGRKLSKKRTDPFLRKEWYDVMAPNMFQNRAACKTCVTKTIGLKIAADSLRGRVFELNLGDLNKNEELGYRKIKLRVDEVQGRKCLTSFYGMDLTNDRLKSLIKKWQTLIEAHAEVKTTDGYFIRMFCVAFTAKQANAVRRPGHPLTVYAQSGRVHRIRKRMIEIMTREASSCELKDLVKKFIAEDISKQIKKSCFGIYPIDNVFIRKVKLLKAPKVDAAKLAELHGDVAAEDKGKTVAKKN